LGDKQSVETVRHNPAVNQLSRSVRRTVGSIGWAKRLEPVLLLHIRRDCDAAQTFDLPLREAADERAQHSRSKSWATTVENAKSLPRSGYTFVTPYWAGISARSGTHEIRPAWSHSVTATARSGPRCTHSKTPAFANRS